MTDQELQESKKRAEAKARELKLDQAIRTICKLKGTGDGINYYVEWFDLRLSATFGAGTNSTKVKSGEDVLYHASDYGRYIETFKFGSWATDLCRESDRLYEMNELQKIAEQADKNDAEALKFQPIDNAQMYEVVRTTEKELHLMGAYVAVCWNLELQLRSVVMNGVTYTGKETVRSGGPYIDFVVVHRRGVSRLRGCLSVLRKNQNSLQGRRNSSGVEGDRRKYADCPIAL